MLSAHSHTHTHIPKPIYVFSAAGFVMKSRPLLRKYYSIFDWETRLFGRLWGLVRVLGRVV